MVRQPRPTYWGASLSASKITSLRGAASSISVPSTPEAQILSSLFVELMVLAIGEGQPAESIA